MADILDANGLQVKTFSESLNDLQTSLTDILGSDVNFDSNTPDGNLLNTVSLMATDLRNLLLSINANFDPEQAQGIILDQRVALNNIQRQAGTFTLQDIEVVVDRSLTLQGLDTAIDDIEGEGFTISDGSGNEFILANTVNLTAGTHILSFRAKQIGATTTTPNTIDNFVNIVLGVVSVNNPTAAQEIGNIEETDPQLRARRRLSVANNSQGYIDGLFGNLLNLNSVVDVKVYENSTNSTVDTIPPHSIWAIIQGGSNEDIANTIYALKTAGCGMKGNVSFEIITQSGGVENIKFDRPLSENLYIKFDIKRTKTGQVFNESGIKDHIVNNLNYSIGSPAETSLITTIAREGINNTSGGGVPLNVEISKDDITYEDYLETTNLNNLFTTGNALITINIL